MNDTADVEVEAKRCRYGMVKHRGIPGVPVPGSGNVSLFQYEDEPEVKEVEGAAGELGSECMEGEC